MTGDLPTNPSDANGADVPHHGEATNPAADPQGESLGGGDQHVDGAARDLHGEAPIPVDDTFEGDDDERHDAAPPGSSPRASAAERHIENNAESNFTLGLTAGQERAIVALMAEPSIAKAARSANVGERTLHSWLGEREFSKAYREARRRAFAQAIALTHKMAAAAVQTLAKVMIDTTAPHAAKVSAATSLLRFSRESIELDDLAARLEDLERRVGDEP